MLADDDLGSTREDVSEPLNSQYVEAFQAIERDANQMMAVFDQHGAVVGCLQLSFIPGLSYVGLRRGQIESVRIARSVRGGGLGRQMIEWAIDECRSRGCGLVQLAAHKSREDAHRFYCALGFEATHEGLKLSF